MKEIVDELDMLRAIVNSVLPTVCKKNLVEPTQQLFMEHIDEINNKVKNLFCD